MDCRISLQDGRNVVKLLHRLWLKSCRASVKEQPVEIEPGCFVRLAGRILNEHEQSTLNAALWNIERCSVNELPGHQTSQARYRGHSGSRGLQWSRSLSYWSRLRPE